VSAVTADDDIDRANSPRSGVLGGTVLAVRFATELALLAVLVIVALNSGLGLAARIALAVAGPAAVAVVWGIGIAPRARRRWPDPWRIAAEIVLFLAASVALVADTSTVAGIVFGVVTIGTAFAVRVVAPGG
jgi:hypothetical protein